MAGSQKYHTARRAKKPIVTVEWVKDSFRKSVLAEDHRYALPALQGLVVAVSDIDGALRGRIEEDLSLIHISEPTRPY